MNSRILRLFCFASAGWGLGGIFSLGILVYGIQFKEF